MSYWGRFTVESCPSVGKQHMPVFKEGKWSCFDCGEPMGPLSEVER